MCLLEFVVSLHLSPEMYVQIACLGPLKKVPITENYKQHSPCKDNLTRQLHTLTQQRSNVTGLFDALDVVLAGKISTSETTASEF